jgi:hypothetical protein
VGQHRSTQRYERVPAEYELRLVARMNELAPRGCQNGEGIRVGTARGSTTPDVGHATIDIVIVTQYCPPSVE